MFMFEFIHAALSLALTGDYMGWMRPYLGEEDSPLVDFILSIIGK